MRANWGDLSTVGFDSLPKKNAVCILPVGSVEQHGEHLPLKTDSFIADSIANRLMDKAQQGPPMIKLPTFWAGYSRHHMDFAGSITLQDSTLVRATEDILASVIRNGIRRILILNAHGGNTECLRIAARRLSYENAAIIVSSYWETAPDRIAEVFSERPPTIGHAGEPETSLFLALGGKLLTPDVNGLEPVPRPVAYLGAAFFQPFRAFTASGYIGNPSAATRAKGEAFLDTVVERLYDLVIELSKMALPAGRRQKDEQGVLAEQR